MREENLLEQVQKVVEEFGCTATDLGPDAVGVKGDARFYGPSVYVTFPPEMTPEQISHVSTEITNRVQGVSRVLMNVIGHDTS